MRLLLAGEGPSRRSTRRRSRSLPASIAERVVFLGAVWAERADLYASAHCFALGARKASFSILLLEAFAAGLRVAALPGEGTSRAGDHWSLAEMARNRRRPRTMPIALRRALAPAAPGYAARARAMARSYDWSRMVPRIRRVYEDALGARRQTIGSHMKKSAANTA